MNRLVAFGCSNTYGQALEDNYPYVHGVWQPSRFAWPQVLADMLDYECLNLGRGGASNKRIAHEILNTKFKQTDIVVCMWTYTARHCFLRQDSDTIRLLPSDLKRHGLKLPPSANKKITKFYYQNLHSIYDAWHESFVQINNVSAYLRHLKIPNYHIVFDIDRGASGSPPLWNRVELIPIKFSNVDLALDHDHPGPISHQKMAQDIADHIS